MTKIKRTAILALIICITLQARSNLSENASIDVQRLSDRALLLQVQGDQNVVALYSAKGIVVIDTTISRVFAQKVRKEIEKNFANRNFAYVINTHFHGDHTLGNQIFNDAVIIGHKNCLEQMKTDHKQRTSSLDRYQAAVANMQKSLEKLEADSDQAKALAGQIFFYQALIDGLGEGFVLTPPALTFSDRMTLDLGDLTLHLYHYGTSHTNSDIIIHCPEEGLWMTGDLFAAGQDPYIDTERIDNMPKWSSNLDKILDTRSSTHYVIAGHGEFIAIAEMERISDFVKQESEKYQGKESAFREFTRQIEEQNLNFALKSLREMAGRLDTYYVLHPEIDQYAYRMMLDGRVEDSLKIFNSLAELFPKSDIAFDSLGEAYLKLNNTDQASDNFKKALELNPDNRNAGAKLKALQAKKDEAKK